MKHANLSPSSSHRWLVCPGSVAVNTNKPHTTNRYAVEGTSAHALLETSLRTGIPPEELEGAVLEKGLMPTDEGMIDGVGYALDYVRAYVAANPGTRVLPEHRVRYAIEIGAPTDDAFGTGDILLDNYPKEAIAIDYKHGSGVSVSVKANSQLLLYLVGMRQARGRYQRYRAVVVQPRIPKRKPVQEAPVLLDKQLTQWVDKVVRPVVPIALSSNAPRVAGAHCQYCAADGNCDAQYMRVLNAAQKEFKI